MHFRTRVSLYTLVAAIIPLAIAMGLTLWTVQQFLIQVALDETSANVKIETSIINDYFLQRLSEIGTYANMPLLQKAPFEESLPYFRQELERQQGIYDKFVLSYPSGHFLTTKGGNPWQGMIQTFNNQSPGGTPRSLSMRSYWQFLVGKNNQHEFITHISNPVISLTTDRRQIVIGASIIDQKKNLLGLVAGTVPWVNIAPLLDQAEADLKANYPSAKLVLISQDGSYWHHFNPAKEVNIVYDSNGKPIRTTQGEKRTEATNIHTEENPILRKVGIRTGRGESGYYYQPDGANDEYLFYQPMSSSHYSILLYIDKDDIFNPLADILEFFAYALAGAGLLAIIISLLFSRQVATPIKRLTETAEKLQNEPILLQSSDFYTEDLQVSELESLNRAFLRLANTINTREKALQECQDRFNLALQSANVGFWDWNIETGEIYFAPHWYALFGYEENDIPSHFNSWQALIVQEDQLPFQQALENFLHSDETEFNYEIRMRHRNGCVLYILNRGIVQRSPSQTPMRMAGIHTNITPHKDTEQSLQALNNELEARIRERTFELEQAYRALKKDQR